MTRKVNSFEESSLQQVTGVLSLNSITLCKPLVQCLTLSVCVMDCDFSLATSTQVARERTGILDEHSVYPLFPTK